MPSVKNIIVLPVSGDPYIEANDYVNMSYKALQNVVGGCVEQVNNHKWYIHPMCVNNNEKWNWVYQFIKKHRKNQYKLYVHDYGRLTECANMALIYESKDFSLLQGKKITQEDIENCPNTFNPLFGRCALVVEKSLITSFHNNYNHNEEYSMLQRKVIDADYEEEEEEEDPYADEKAYDEYKGK